MIRIVLKNLKLISLFSNKAINSYKNNFDHQAICKDLTELSPEKFNKLCSSILNLYEKKIISETE